MGGEEDDPLNKVRQVLCGQQRFPMTEQRADFSAMVNLCLGNSAAIALLHFFT